MTAPRGYGTFTGKGSTRVHDLHIVEPRKAKDRNFLKMYMPHITDAINELNGASLKLILWLTSKMDYENVVHSHQAEMAKELGLSPKTINIAIKELIDKDYIRPYKNIGRAILYKVSPMLAVKVGAAPSKKLQRNWIEWKVEV